LNCCLKLYIILKKYMTNQIVFQRKKRRLHEILDHLEKGGIAIDTNLELAMREDIETYMKYHEDANAIQVDQKQYTPIPMPVTKKFTKWTNMLGEYLLLFLKIFISNTEFICYMAMLSSMFISAGLIGLFYPLSIFGYALLEETRPSKKYWYMVLIYTSVLLILKFSA